MAGPPPTPSDTELLVALRHAAGTRRIGVERGEAKNYLDALGYDIQAVCELLADCEDDDLIGNEPDDRGRNDRIAKLVIHVEGERLPFYIKVALHLPDMASGLLLSFKLR